MGREDPLEKEMETHSSILAGKSLGRRSLPATVHGVAEPDTTKRLHFFPLPRAKKGMSTNRGILYINVNALI